MQRVIAGLCTALLLLAVGCSSDNDPPDSAADDETTTSEAEDTTSTTAGGPFGGDTTTTTAGGGESGDGENPDGGEGEGEAPSTPTGTGSVDPTSPVDADTPADLGAALEGCENYADVSPALQQPGTSAEGTCEFGGEIVNLYLFASSEDQAAFVDEGAFFDCSFIVAFGGGGSTYYVAGDKWIARPGTEGVARDMAAALDGEVAAYTCEA